MKLFQSNFLRRSSQVGNTLPEHVTQESLLNVHKNVRVDEQHEQAPNPNADLIKDAVDDEARDENA